MVNDSDIHYAEAEVRRLESEFAEKRNSAVSEADKEALAQLEKVLESKRQNLRDLQSRKRNEDDQKKREAEQKARDDRRKRLS